jgi:hypothetical protein
MTTARRLIFLKFLKESIADLITLFFSSLQNSEGGGDSDRGDSFADPCQFLPFPKTKFFFFHFSKKIQFLCTFMAIFSGQIFLTSKIQQFAKITAI